MADSDQLRDQVTSAIMGCVQPMRRVDQPGICDALGLPSAPDDPDLSKREYIATRLSGIPDDPVAIAEKFVEMFPVASGSSSSFAIEEILWRDRRDVSVSKKHRRELARSLCGVPLALHSEGLMSALSRLWVLDGEPFIDYMTESSLRARIERHVIQNPEDRNVETLFDAVGAFDCTDYRFVRFLESLVDHRVRPDEDAQRFLVAKMNESLAPIGIRFQETGVDGGYPVFGLSSDRNLASRPKNLIFASSVKPDLRFVDAINNDIEVVSRSDKVLIYDRPISDEGLTWQQLQDWWADFRGLGPGDAKASLYRRLKSSLPEDSPPQRLLFDAYHRAFGAAIPALPALLPEVWLHYDPVTIARRGRDALFRQRMDFLLLVSARRRIVIEVDGAHHYATGDVYADTMKADRDLRLSGYEVYRFGAKELLRVGAKAAAVDFFHRLYESHGISGK